MKRFAASLLLGFVCMGAYAQTKDTVSVLCIGNSFTYVHDTPDLLRKIASSEGHPIKIEVSTRGGWTFGKHVVYIPTVRAIAKGGYDYAFLQDQSQASARYDADKKKYAHILTDTGTLKACVRTVSRSCVCFYERTWSYPGLENANLNGNFETEAIFDKHLARGAKVIAKRCGMKVSPIGDAFRKCRELYPHIPLLNDSDHHHQNFQGAYLKACVNYLMLFRAPFGPQANDCGLDHEVAATLRSVAENAVLGKALSH